MIDAHHLAMMQQRTQMLVQGDDLGKVSSIGIRSLQKVPFDSKRSEDRRNGTKAEPVGSPRRVRNRRADVAAHQLRREQQREAALYLLAIESIDRAVTILGQQGIRLT